jgi:hypothetical protein
MPDRMSKAREARAQKRRERAEAEANDRPNPRTALTPVEREQARVDMANGPHDLREAHRIRVEQTGMRPFAGDNFGTHPLMTDEEPSGRRFVVQHGAVGPHPRGAVVHESHIGDQRAIDRLIGLGAIKAHREDSDEDDEDEDIFDIADIESPPEPSLTESAYSESPPTLPHVQGIDATQEEARHAVRTGVGTSQPREETAEAQTDTPARSGSQSSGATSSGESG